MISIGLVGIVNGELRDRLFVGFEHGGVSFLYLQEQRIAVGTVRVHAVFVELQLVLPSTPKRTSG